MAVAKRFHSTDSSPRFLTPDELADLFAIPLETVYQWRRKHTGPPGFRVGRHLRYDLAAVLAWVADQTRAGVN
ncbi:AlpA family transcriptional regulator [Nonomuraea sp. NEAU-A123]|uniref:helix-turn-helix transcriptional regulator n=1 Tax=Nonomuraea sp. NEAU-A123 TaxID=2839649 RepID=UPI001BE3F46A|nr:helix-turn-helix domain-containing protein [Nonomuraea sp. NEAU-A123]MBT2224445.1 helix-turn-helix domain-containing protein [Nonomuraea sp. NEAU-A123]